MIKSAKIAYLGKQCMLPVSYIPKISNDYENTALHQTKLEPSKNTTLSQDKHATDASILTGNEVQTDR